MFPSEFQRVGRDLFTRGLISSHAGNLSIRMGDNLIITRRGSQLGSLEEQDLIETGIFKNDRYTPLASTELAVHREIYRNTRAQAIVHAHPPHAIALSLKLREIVPNCTEYLASLGKIPVLGWDTEVKAGGLADVIACSLKDHRIVVVHGHGSFAIGQILDEAYNYTTALEQNSQVNILLRSMDAGQSVIGDSL